MTDQPVTFSRLIVSPAFKFFLISFLILLLIVPLVLVMVLVSEREGRAREAQGEIARIWGGAQLISGPFLVVPYTVKVETTTQQGAKTEQLQERRAVFLPEALDVQGDTRSRVLHRSIFDVTVYSADTTIAGRFGVPVMSDVEINPVSIRWRDAIVALSLSDVAGLKEAATLTVNGGERLAFAPSIGVPGAYQSGIHVKLGGAASAYPVADAAPAAFSFQMKLVFSGSTSLMVAPAARETTVALTSDWPHPSFSGAFLPAERDVREDGFSATWRVPHLARSVPDAWSTSDAALDRFNASMFGVTYFMPVEFYDLVTRATKYALLFISFAFMAVFVIELISARRVHPIQYLFVGIAMIFFYVLLLSLSEHTGFATAYLAASIATGGMLTLYVGKSLRSWVSGLVMLSVFLVLYGLLYLILQLEDYALLAGAVLGFATLTVVMFATLRVDWSGSGRDAAKVAA